MSQEYFDCYVNRTGYAASQMAAVIDSNQIIHEEIANWIEEDWLC